MLKQVCLAVVIGVPCYVLGCSSDDADSPMTAGSAGQGQAGEETATGTGGQVGDGPGGGGGAGQGGAGQGGAGQGGAGQGGAFEGGAAQGGSAATLDCGTGDICFSLDGMPLQKPGGGYRLTHETEGDYAFVKYQDGIDQLSIEIYSLEPGTFEVLDVPTAGAARIAWYHNSQPEQIYQGRSGTVTVTELDDEFFITGSFEAVLERTENEAYTGETRSVTSGSFHQIFLPKI
jgi:hypothetical protein